MSNSKNNRLTRREFIKASTATTLGVAFLPQSVLSQKSSVNDVLNISPLLSILKRKFGSLDFEVTTMGLGGQAALQITPADLDPSAIIIKAIKLGINYFDTSNTYGKSQLNYNKAFKTLNLIPGQPDYDTNLRTSIWLTSKTKMKWGKSGYPELPNVENLSNGAPIVKCAVDDLKRSLSQVFGDNMGNYPQGAYLDMFLMHSIDTINTNDVLLEGLETPLDPDGNFGALVALRDYRDGTNLTGMNPNNEKLVRHIGFSGHSSPPVMMDLIQRDEYGILEGLLVAINPNDKIKFSMQNNVIPVAAAKGMGIIGMKVFADAALYHKSPNWSSSTADLFLGIGTSELPSKPLIEYTLTSGVHVAIVGIGHIDDDPQQCQLVRNFTDSQIEPDGMTAADRKSIEDLTKQLKPRSNYFQLSKIGLTKPQNLRNEGNVILWDNAFAGDFPVKKYEVIVNNVIIGEVEHQPQTLKSLPFIFEYDLKSGDKVEVAAVDENGRRATELLNLKFTASDSNPENNFKLYPNPVQTELYISGMLVENSIISIQNAAGRKLDEKIVDGTPVKFDVSKLNRGLYFARFSDGSSKKFIIQ